MKKLMIALAAVAVGMMANAASYTWSSGGRIFNGTGASGSDNYVTGVTAYLMFESVVGVESLVSSFQSSAATATSTVTAKAIATATVSDGAQISSTASYATTDSQTAYFVIFANDKMYVSNTAAANYNSLDPSEVNAINFGAQSTPSKLSFDSGTYATNGAGWYQAAAVPEPTSGLLMLLGMAGLALRRKRA